MPAPNDQPITLALMRQVFYSAVVCDALDAMGYPHQSPRVQLKPLTTTGVLIGRCKTTLWADMAHPDPQPYDLELKAVDTCQPDDVLIAAAGGSMRSGLWGELLSTAARRSGCVGTIVDGAVRDVNKMSAMGFPIWARGTCLYDSKDRNRVIDIDVPVEIDGVRFSPGDLVVADIDGIVVVPREIEDKVVQYAWNKVNDENVVRQAIADGMTATAAFQKYGVL
ncbi:4-hydroxy-4-methyl-2-oxoglutarate aldolase [Anatilimnocola aggregata]|uniref:Putative 4-hydroxy-4-methyl-2-oxoglutarate aldolase n=1 Tax=Anatilimnocola aggregata TaxID=2528021 RepID=A0A517YJ98_9BACT|nr:RraA family protein [Anatilimnocola aggregata]QDU30303.1 4-hydroxy-4-methyl-2-oxoglutarate aldolase [Anatilimnocola aggregata]